MAWNPTHSVPQGGLVTIVDNQPSTPLEGGQQVELAERSGAWARVVVADGSECWVDGSSLVALAPTSAGSPPGPPPGASPPGHPTLATASGQPPHRRRWPIITILVAVIILLLAVGGAGGGYLLLNARCGVQKGHRVRVEGLDLDAEGGPGASTICRRDCRIAVLADRRMTCTATPTT
jgi:hypothetical protein